MKSRCMGFIELKDLNSPWRQVLHLGVRRTLPRASQVVHSQELLFLDKGVVRLTHNTQDGKEKILWYIAEGCIFGETPFFDPQEETGESVHICATPCVIYAFSPTVVQEQILTSYPELILNLLPSLARKVRLLSNQASSLSVDEVSIRLCKFLGQRIVVGSDPLRVNPGISRQDMASLLGVHRITLFKTLKQMEEAGVFSPYDRNSFVILQPEIFFQLMQS